MSRRARAWRAAVVLAVVARLGISCTDGDDTVAPTSTTVAEAPATTAITASTNPMPVTVDLAALAPCRPDMGSTHLEQYFNVPPAQRPQPAPGYTPSPRDGFDWNGDGQPDRLVIGQPPGTITLDWGSGQLTVTGVNTDFTQVFTDANGNRYGVEGRPGQVVPAGVADITGDDQLDRIVAHQGTVAVLAGARDATPRGAFAFPELGRTAPGWQSPPRETEPVRDSAGNVVGPSQFAPTPIGTVEFPGDITHDGVPDFVVRSLLERAEGSPQYYAGLPCRSGG